MGDNVIHLGDKPPSFGEPNQGLVDGLEDMVRMAKSGELQSFIGTGFTSTNQRVSISGGWLVHNVYEMLGSIVWLEHEYIDTVTGRKE